MQWLLITCIITKYKCTSLLTSEVYQPHFGICWFTFWDLLIHIRTFPTSLPCHKRQELVLSSRTIQRQQSMHCNLIWYGDNSCVYTLELDPSPKSFQHPWKWFKEVTPHRKLPLWGESADCQGPKVNPSSPEVEFSKILKSKCLLKSPNWAICLTKNLT